MRCRFLFFGSLAGFVVLAVSSVLLVNFSSNRPSLSLSFWGYDRNGEDTYGVVQIRNTGYVTVTYDGYGLDSPFYRLMEHSDDGWKNGPNVGRCGTGARSVSLRPGGSATVRIYLRTNQMWRVGITFSPRTFQDSLPSFLVQRLPTFLRSQSPSYTAWSPPIWHGLPLPLLPDDQGIGDATGAVF